MFNLKQIISSIADAGQKLLNRKDIKKNDIDTILSLCDDLISNKGAAFGITVARDITKLYQALSSDNKLIFFKRINEKYKANFTKVDEAINFYKISPNEKTLANLFKVSSGKRRELFTRMNMAPNGTSVIIELREDLLKILKDNKDLKVIDDDLRYLFKGWFNPGFLKLEKITWDTKAAVLEKIIKYERVHQMKDMNELKRRLGEDRRFFSYFHPALEDEPIIFVQVALTKGLGKSIQELMKPSNNEKKNYDTATFYSISNCQEGLSRVTLGNFLIKRVVYELQEELPHIKNFGTLSPIPGFTEWFSYLVDSKIKNILTDFKDKDLSFLKSKDLKIGDNRIIEHKEALIKLVTHYIINEKNKDGLPMNDVCRFHLGNGAIVEDIVINANISEQGFKRSYGVMINYFYELNTIEKNHEEYMNNKKVIVSDKIKKYIKS
jgi:malonyl-CoA decarboxylase